MTKIFIDCGAHCGESILRAKSQFGHNTRVISFEAIPKLAEELSKIYENDDSVQICNAAVYVEDGVIDINICPAFTDGSSILTSLNDNHKASKIKVPCFDLSSWIKNTFTKDDYVILKLDIEGAEYEVLKKLIAEGSIHMIKELWGEWHLDHIIDNLSEEEKSSFIELSNNIKMSLSKLSKDLKIWEAYYTDSPMLAKRPTSLYE